MGHNNGPLRVDDWGQWWSDEWMEKRREDGADCMMMDRMWSGWFPLIRPWSWLNRPLSTAVRGRFSMHGVFLHAIEVFLLWHCQNGSQYLIVFPVCKACCRTKETRCSDRTDVIMEYPLQSYHCETVILQCFQNMTRAWCRNIDSVDGLSLRWDCLFG